MSAYIKDIRQGDNYLLKLQYADGTDLTGYEHELVLSTAFPPDNTVALDVNSIAAAHPLDDLAQFYVYLELTAVQTAGLTIGDYKWQVRSKDADDRITTLFPPIEEYSTDTVAVIPQVASFD